MSEPVWTPVLPKKPKAYPVNGKWAKGAGGALVWADLPTPPVGTPPPGITTPSTAWQVLGVDVPFQNGWQSWPDVNYSPARFRRLADGLVVCEGLIGGAGTGGFGNTVFAFPAGYRPANTGPLHWYTGSSVASPSIPWGVFWLHEGDGQLYCNFNGSGFWTSLHGISFYAP